MVDNSPCIIASGEIEKFAPYSVVVDGSALIRVN